MNFVENFSGIYVRILKTGEAYMIRYKKSAVTVAFAAFLFLQFVVLRFSNQAGRGFLPENIQEWVYCFTQIIVIAGFLLHSFLAKTLLGKPSSLCALGALLLGSGYMMLASADSALYLAVTGVSVLCLGIVGGAVYLRVALFSERLGLSFGVAYSFAILVQYIFQLEWTILPVIIALSLAAFAALTVFFIHKFPEAQPKSEFKSSKLAFAAVITAAMLIFTVYYTSYIHHLQIASGYTEYNVYSWPRLLMIPGVLAFGVVGDIKSGKYLPLCALLMVAFALLNTVLISRDTYLLNMCLYYLAIAAAVSYYNITFPRLAQGTKNPALWAPFGRMLDSLVVILSFLLSFSTLSTAVVLVIDIVSLGIIIVMMAINGDFNLSSEPVSKPEKPEVDFDSLRELYNLTPTELKVFRELVSTEDKQDAIASRLNISVNTLRHHITSIYRKTETQTRAGLCRLVK